MLDGHFAWKRPVLIGESLCVPFVVVVVVVGPPPALPLFVLSFFHSFILSFSLFVSLFVGVLAVDRNVENGDCRLSKTCRDRAIFAASSCRKKKLVKKKTRYKWVSVEQNLTGSRETQ